MFSDFKGSICRDFKFISLFLFGKQVLVNTTLNSPSYLQYGPVINGIIEGRIWGIPKDAYFSDETVVAITIKTHKESITVDCHDIESIEQVCFPVENL